MEIIFIPKGLGEQLMNEPLSEIVSNEFDEIKDEINLIDKSSSFNEVNLGTNADWIAVLAIINGITSVLLVGDKIVKGIDGWVTLAKRIKKIFSKSDNVYLDIDAATILAIEYLTTKHRITSIKKIGEYTLALKDLSISLLDRKQDDFIAKPYNIYVMSFEINENIVVMLGVKSNGEINNFYSFDDITAPVQPF